MDFAALRLTLELAALTTALLLCVSVPLAAWVAGSTRWYARAVEAAIALPLVLPPTVLGFYLLVGLGPRTAAGRAIATLLGHSLAFSFAGLVVGSMLYSLPFAMQPLIVAFRAVPALQREAASILGASPLQVFRRITLPLAKQGFLAAAVLAFAHTVGEFGVVLMLGGDIPGSTRTLSIAIFDQVQEGNYAAANTMSLALLVLSFVALLAVYARRSRRSAHA
ncbi:molybdate ABC transporter permease subunit [Granulicella cerasi]|uniref:Molybdenum transport system permease n=1 Tax=Granulicella cerasi TaxID=741063 RepID=A0ABW1ZH42_9BACT|nr:molybdate ABC transporter permease subunit [Granulicella cerasi]